MLDVRPATVRTAPDKGPAEPRKRLRALLLADRIDTSNFEQDGVVSTAPLAFKYGQGGFVTLFRYGVAVFIGLTAAEEGDMLDRLRPRLVRPVRPFEEEIAVIEHTPEKDDQILPGGPIALKTITPDHLTVIADALSKSVVLARDEREVAAVFEVVEPFARQLADHGRTFADRPDLDRLYSRLEDEYELKERAETLARKFAVISDAAELLTDIIDTRRSLRLEIVIVVLIAVELIIAGYQTLH